MTEHPILMSAPMVRAILDGHKTQTRRIVRWNGLAPGLNLGFSGLDAAPYFTGCPECGWTLYSRGGGGVWNQNTKPTFCPYGNPGDRLWVREAWNYTSGYTDENGGWCPAAPVAYRADGSHPKVTGWRPSIHMPRALSRLALRVEAVRVERLQAITADGVSAEGFPDAPNILPRGVDAFAELWDRINGKRPGAAWDANPFVWVVTFARIPLDK